MNGITNRPSMFGAFYGAAGNGSWFGERVQVRL